MAQAISGDDWAVRRQHMVDGQLRSCDVTDQAVLAAFANIPREAFVAPAFASLAYVDRDVPALGAHDRVLLAPMVLAKLIQAANVQPGEKALDVAGGSGYSALVLASLGAHVVALESDEGAVAAAKVLLAKEKSVEIVAGDLADGAPGPFDIILVNGAFESSPEKLLDQLAPGGRLVGVDASFNAAKAVFIERIGGVTSRRVLFDATAVKLQAFRPTPSFAF
ncbi:protein-L-isoaspartate O-methyltransferase [Methylocapsa sp. S129]|uniref:protein-L-isoaspartate O-methyltransferase family protein n=1 Tax=Methylocapsa sp. S129 TaxID=1641869 RepID=UPI00131D7444|nr:protein-L-isoaspartate O-methyltransferase [Methylocapsa sp. S129]